MNEEKIQEKIEKMDEEVYNAIANKHYRQGELHGRDNMNREVIEFLKNKSSILFLNYEDKSAKWLRDNLIPEIKELNS